MTVQIWSGKSGEIKAGDKFWIAHSNFENIQVEESILWLSRSALWWEKGYSLEIEVGNWSCSRWDILQETGEWEEIKKEESQEEKI